MKLWSAAGLLLTLSAIANCEIIERKEELFGEDYVVSWVADTVAEKVTFEVVAKTTGYVGFGISRDGTMFPADVIIGGVDDATGEVYFSDRHTTAHAVPVVDDQQDWFLISATQSDTTTTLKFNRSLVTCDEVGDITITSDFTNFIWSMGNTDTISYHASRGSSEVYVLDPPGPVPDVSTFETWSILVDTPMPPRDTSYWCTVHKTPPNFNVKRHIVGFEVPLNSTEALTHTHHLILHHCPVALGSPEADMMEAALRGPGGECTESLEDGGMMDLLRFCQVYLYVWAKGGKPFFTPEDVGIPLNENGYQEYFLMELHYDNPQVLTGVQYVTGVQMYTTTELRPVEGGIINIARPYSIDFMIPPNATNYAVNSHCNEACTASIIPPDGLQAYNVLLHSHLAGRKMKLRHFRGTTELPWVLNDNAYNFDFQQSRPLPQRVPILPGDHLTVECIYDATDRTAPTWGGESARSEMCEAFIMYYPRVSTIVCGSRFVDEDILFGKYGIEEIDRSTNVVLRPPELAGMTYQEVLAQVNWTPELTNEISNTIFNRPQMAFCWQRQGISSKSYVTSTAMEARFMKPISRAENPEGFTTYPENYTAYIPPNPEEKCELVKLH